jgi:xylulokinase
MFRTWLAFDIGTSAVKAALINADGETIRSISGPYETNSAAGGVVEQNANDWWTALIEAAQALKPSEADAITVTGQMQDVILLNDAGEPVRPVVLYSDTRAQDEIAGVLRIIPQEQLRALTGNDQDASSLLAKLRWLKHHEPTSIERSTALLLGAADYGVYKLTGIAFADITTASTTGLMNIESRQFHDTELWSRLGLEDVIHLLPPVQSGGTLAGTLLPEIAAQIGAKAHIPVYHAPGDAGATTLGVGSGESQRPYAYIGTSGWIGFTAEKRADSQTGAFNLAHPAEDRYFCLAPLLTAGGNLDWAISLFERSDYDAAIRTALDQPAGNLIYLPYLNGERSPFHDPLARGAFIGLHSRHTEPDLLRAVLEGIAFAYHHALETLIPDLPTQIMLTGGGTRSGAWCQLFADVLKLPVLVSKDAENVGVRGAVLSAQVARGERENYAPPDFFPIAATYQPDKTLANHYDRLYQHFRAAYTALKDVFQGLSEV